MSPESRRAPPRRCLRVAAVLAVVAAGLAALPGATAQTVVFDTVHVLMTPNAFDAELRDQQIEDDRARSLRGFVDEEHGDGDGIVTEEEHEAYRAAEIARFNGQLDNDFAAGLFGDVKVNDFSPRRISVTDVTLSPNIVGSVDDNETVQRHVFARLEFRDRGETRLNVSLEQDFRVPFRIIEMEWGVAHFSGDGAWAIDPATFVPEGTEEFWVEPALVVPYDEMGNFSSKRDPLRFDLVNTSAEKLTDEGKGDKKDSPGVPVWAPALGIMALVALVRRRS